MRGGRLTKLSPLFRWAKPNSQIFRAFSQTSSESYVQGLNAADVVAKQKRKKKRGRSLTIAQPNETKISTKPKL